MLKLPSVSRKSDSQANEYKQSMTLSPEKDRYYSTRGSPFPFEGNGFDFGGLTEEKGTTALPRFFIALSNKEKEEDFMAMKGCKLPQRPKKRPKLMQKCLHVMPKLKNFIATSCFISSAMIMLPFFLWLIDVYFICGTTTDGEPRSLVVRSVTWAIWSSREEEFEKGNLLMLFCFKKHILYLCFSI